MSLRSCQTKAWFVSKVVYKSSTYDCIVLFFCLFGQFFSSSILTKPITYTIVAERILDMKYF